MTNRTLILLASDNGGLACYAADGIDSDEVTSQEPLRGGKGMLYEGGIRVPMVASWPGVIVPWTTCDIPVSVIDFYFTIREAAGIRGEAGCEVDGESLMLVLAGTDAGADEGALQRDSLFWHLPAYLEGRNGTWRSKPGAAIRWRQFKLLEFFEDGRLELYDLEQDIGERHNLVDEHPDLTKELHRRMIEWRLSIGALVPTERNPAYAPDRLDRAL